MRKLPFPLELLVPQTGTLEFNDFGGSLDIPLEPFELPYWGKVETRLLIDCLPLAKEELAGLPGRRLRFKAGGSDPEAPEGSVYIGHAHHPVDLLSIRFEQGAGGLLQVQISLLLAFDFEGLSAGDDCEYADTAWEIGVTLVAPAPPTLH